MSFAPVAFGAFERALDSASTIDVSAYLLERRGPLVSDLERAAARGASVHVTLEGATSAGRSGVAQRMNAATARELRSHGVAVRLTAADAPELHLKAAVVDGRAYLDDRNWTGADTVVATRVPAIVAAVGAAIAGGFAANADLALTKGEALAREAEIIRSADADRIDVASESFEASPVATALAARARNGAHVRLVFARATLSHASPSERTVLRRLAAAGVELRAGPASDKVCVAGATAWLGSANATFWPPSMIDWGLTSRSPALLALAANTFSAAWERARPVSAMDLAPVSG